MPDLLKIQAAGRHLLTLINDLLDLSKIEAGKLELTLETCDAGAIAREVAATVHPLVQKNGNILRLSVPDWNLGSKCVAPFKGLRWPCAIRSAWGVRYPPLQFPANRGLP